MRGYPPPEVGPAGVIDRSDFLSSPQTEKPAEAVRRVYPAFAG